MLNISASISSDGDSGYFDFLIFFAFLVTQPFCRAIPQILPLPPASENPPQTRSSIAARVPDEQWFPGTSYHNINVYLTALSD